MFRTVHLGCGTIPHPTIPVVPILYGMGLIRVDTLGHWLPNRLCKLGRTPLNHALQIDGGGLPRFSLSVNIHLRAGMFQLSRFLRAVISDTRACFCGVQIAACRCRFAQAPYLATYSPNQTVQRVSSCVNQESPY